MKRFINDKGHISDKKEKGFKLLFNSKKLLKNNKERWIFDQLTYDIIYGPLMWGFLNTWKNIHGYKIFEDIESYWDIPLGSLYNTYRNAPSPYYATSVEKYAKKFIKLKSNSKLFYYICDSYDFYNDEFIMLHAGDKDFFVNYNGYNINIINNVNNSDFILIELEQNYIPLGEE